MKFFDTHLHLPRATRDGVTEFVEKLAALPGACGGLLVLNTPQEVAAVEDNFALIPRNVVPVPYFAAEVVHSPEIVAAGWYKIHPGLQKIDHAALDRLVADVVARAPRGVMVHCFPWGPELQYNVSLPCVIRLARALPETCVLATHGGGYESWQFRAHAGGLKNVHFDFSMTLDYYEGSDLLRPLQRYLRYSSGRVHFGSDWPSGGIEKQLNELLRLASEIGIPEDSLERILIDNAKRCWPVAFDVVKNMDVGR